MKNCDAMKLYLLKKVLTQIKGKRRKIFTRAVAIAVSHIRSELVEIKDRCESFEKKEGVSKYSVEKHPAGFIGFTFCYNNGNIFYEVIDIEFDDDIEMLVFEAEVKSSIVANSDERREYINRVKRTDF
jgi:hypothetical protein